jgi:chemotaxis signal transduction protein
MSESARNETAVKLRREFDAAFARAFVLEPDASEHLLLVRAGERQLAVRAREIAGIMRCPPSAALPSRNPALGGLVGVRGTLVAVYSVSALLGELSGRVASGWIVLCDVDRSAALSFDELAGYERVAVDEIRSPRQPNRGGSASGIEHLRGADRTVLSLPRLLERIRRDSGAGPKEEWSS